MGRIKGILVIAFLVVFGAGLMVGLVRGRSTAIAPPAPPTLHGRGSFLVAELGLFPDQEEKMHKIWSEVTKNGPAGTHRMDEIEKQREQSIRALLHEDQQAQFEELMKEHQARVDAFHAEMRQRMEEAERRTREILTDAQRVKFDEITKRRHDHEREGGRMHGFMPPSPATSTSADVSPQTAPAALQPH